MSYLDRLKNYLLEIIAAKRTPEQEAEDKRLLKEKTKEYEEKVKKRREKEGRVDPKLKDAPIKEEPATDIKKEAEKIKNMETPHLVFIKSDITSTEYEKTKDVLEKSKKNYHDFLRGERAGKEDPELKSALAACYNIANIKDEHVHVWIGDYDHVRELMDGTFEHGLEAALSPIDVSTAGAIEKIKIEFSHPEVPINASAIRLQLKEAWKPFEEILAKKKKPKDTSPKEEEKPEAPEETKEDTPEKDTEETPKEETPKEEVAPEEDDTESGSGDEDYEHHVNVGRYRSMRDPRILILDPRKHNADFQKFISTDEKSGKTLAESSLLLKSKIRSQEGDSVRVYFVSGKNVKAIEQELQKESQLDYQYGVFNKDLFDEMEPFSGLKIKNTPVDPNLIKELNQLWVDASAASGNPIPAIQINSSVSLDFFRFLSKTQRPVDLYVGGIPKGAGYDDTVYVLASEQESAQFIKVLKRFKMPSLFYERLSSNSDIDAEFKKIDPETFTPSNVLILKADGKFNPKELVEINEDNSAIVGESIKESKPLQNRLKQLIKERDAETANLNKVSTKPDPDTKKLTEKIKKLNEEITKLESDLEEYKITQLAILHMFAKQVLDNKLKFVGTFIKNKQLIGTHVVQFNADMTICFIWGSITRHVKVDSKEVMKQLPFVKEVITSYL